mmetsp:Transcript_93041/g.139652  ORF Transcript_93041/g.139652 Transcript_93041/m.139652 type:complete len:125 (-) Transcript_93041:20-394(-)
MISGWLYTASFMISQILHMNTPLASSPFLTLLAQMGRTLLQLYTTRVCWMILKKTRKDFLPVSERQLLFLGWVPSVLTGLRTQTGEQRWTQSKTNNGGESYQLFCDLSDHYLDRQVGHNHNKIN